MNPVHAIPGERHRQLTVNGLDMAVFEYGPAEGRPVLLLHGFPDTHAVWRHQAVALAAAGYRVIAPDVRGHGATEAPVAVAAYRLEQLVADALGLLDALGVREPVNLAGHDLGAITGWTLAARHPERVRRYAALSVGHPRCYRGAPGQVFRGWYALMFQWRGVAEWLLSAGNWRMFRFFIPHPELARWIPDLSRPGRLTATMAWYRANLWRMLRGEFPPARVPTLGIWSTRDVALVEAQMTRSQSQVQAEWRYARIEGASHWLLLDRPEEVNRLLLEWFGA
ncbi:MAG TPA: alpha/beta fold hydrolase [Solimonas sp.]|nr:alpha/beta fold hydrolase [Solimonas sp.]